VETGEIHSRLRHQGGQVDNEVERIKDHMSSIIPVRRPVEGQRRLERITLLTLIEGVPAFSW
jgi:hypothetical protein